MLSREDARAAAWAYHSSRASTSPQSSPSPMRKKADAVEQQQREEKQGSERGNEIKGKAAQVKPRHAVSPSSHQKVAFATPQTRVHPTPSLKMRNSATLSASDAVANRQMQPRMTARGQRRRRLLEEEHAAAQSQPGGANGRSRARTPAQHRSVSVSTFAHNQSTFLLHK